jgi:hypothetical protein
MFAKLEVAMSYAHHRQDQLATVLSIRALLNLQRLLKRLKSFLVLVSHEVVAADVLVDLARESMVFPADRLRKFQNIV